MAILGMGSFGGEEPDDWRDLFLYYTLLNHDVALIKHIFSDEHVENVLKLPQKNKTIKFQVSPCALFNFFFII